MVIMMAKGFNIYHYLVLFLLCYDTYKYIVMPNSFHRALGKCLNHQRKRVNLVINQVNRINGGVPESFVLHKCRFEVEMFPAI